LQYKVTAFAVKPYCNLALISEVEAEEAVKAAEDYLRVVAADIQNRVP
jgi:hypothetical protein